MLNDLKARRVSRRVPRRPFQLNDPKLNETVRALLSSVDAKRRKGKAGVGTDEAFEMIVSALKMLEDTTDPLDFKIARAAAKEMRYAFRVFSPHREIRKVSIWGSARTPKNAPIYAMAKLLGQAMAKEGWMVITGAGDGIMAAGHEGAGRKRSFGLKISLPTEAEPNEYIEDDPKLINFKYFFIRKLFFVRESSAMALFPGGFGTLDEAFELLTLVQTGRSPLIPIVMMDMPDGHYWSRLIDFMKSEMRDSGLIAPEDLNLFRMVHSAPEGVREIRQFYSNYHSMRYVGDLLVLRYHTGLTREALSKLPELFPDLFGREKPEQRGAFPEEQDEPEVISLIRLAFPYVGGMGQLRPLVDFLNRNGAPS